VAVVCGLAVGLVPVDERPVVREAPVDGVGGFVAPVPAVADRMVDVPPIVDPPVANNPAEVLDVEVVWVGAVLAVELVVGAGVLFVARLDAPVPGFGSPSAGLADPVGVPAGAETGAGGAPTVPAPADEGLHPATASTQMTAQAISPGLARCCSNRWRRIQLLDSFGTGGRRKFTRRAS
jgi:hypothetical protein